MAEKVILYGNGASAKGFVLSNFAEFEIVAVASDNPQEDTFEGFYNIATDNIKKHKFDVVIVASWAIHEISERLMGVGIAKPKIRWYQHHKNRVLDWGHSDFSQSHKELAAEQILYCFYDMNVARATYDIIGFLSLAECERIKRKLSGIHVIIVNASNNLFNASRWGIQNKQEHDWRIDQILVQCCSMLPSCLGISKTATREEANKLIQGIREIFPWGYSLARPKIDYEFDLLFERVEAQEKVAHFNAPDEAKNYIEQTLGSLNRDKLPVVTITLRQNIAKPKRNSNIAAWDKTASWLRENGFFVVLVPDSGMLNHKQGLFEGCFKADMVSFNVPLRMALYEQAYLNLGVNNGPMFLCALNEQCNYIIFKQIVEEYPHSSAQSFIERGFTIGGHFPGATANQRMIWQDDDFEVIQQSVLDFLADNPQKEV